MDVTELICPSCADNTRVSLPADWDKLVEQGEMIPIIGCGGPFHYANVYNWQWLASTYKLQSETYGYNLKFLATGADEGDNHFEARQQLAAYIDWNQTAAVQELAELREEFSWKPWAVDKPFVNRRRVLEEIVDVHHFTGNILVGMGVTDEEFDKAYQKKQQKNRERKASGTYSAKKGGLAEGSDL